MIELYPAQEAAYQKLKGLKVGALYIDRQDGKLRTVLKLIEHRFHAGKIDAVVWLCKKRRMERLKEGTGKYLPVWQDNFRFFGLESLSHGVKPFFECLDFLAGKRVMLVIDNGLMIKNFSALRTQRVYALARGCAYRLLIGDMPFSKNLTDVFAQWYALDWRILGYQTMYGFTINHLEENRHDSRNEAYVARRIEPYSAQIIREEVQNIFPRREYVWRFSLANEVMREYRRTVDRFTRSAPLSNVGVYRLLQACQRVASGQRIINDYPLKTESMYQTEGEDARLKAFLEVMKHYQRERVLVLCRYSHECDTVFSAAANAYGQKNVCRYANGRSENRRVTIMHINSEESEKDRLNCEVIVHYSNDWNWNKRQEKERQCQNALTGGGLTVVSLSAVNTVDSVILKSVWRKENVLLNFRAELARLMNK